jgi:hypothetical protein
MDEADVTLLEEFRRREKERRSGKPASRLPGPAGSLAE